MDAKTLGALNLENTQIIVPQAVKDKLPQEMHSKLVVMNNGESREFMGFEIEAIPMYNLPEDPEAFHAKGRGNGYVLEKDGKRLYIAGDTEAIPEMKNLENIDMALVPMNLPYTMDVEQAVEGVLAFEPRQVYPYHFRGTEGFADVDKFKQMINDQNPNIEVVMLNWYPERK
jgi:L-ascorbate metabolism protein UlaG (beta-lactamase superfamily)